MEIKLNDVYRFTYNETWLKKLSYPYHCFDGQLIVKERNGELYLEDTYFGSFSDNKRFTLEEALKKGHLTFVCNLDEVENAGEGDYNYYEDDDVFNLSYQKRCYKRYAKRKGAKRSKNKMEHTIKNKITEIQRDIEWQQRELLRYQEKLHEVATGNLDIYI